VGPETDGTAAADLAPTAAGARSAKRSFWLVRSMMRADLHKRKY